MNARGKLCILRGRASRVRGVVDPLLRMDGMRDVLCTDGKSL